MLQKECLLSQDFYCLQIVYTVCICTCFVQQTCSSSNKTNFLLISTTMTDCKIFLYTSVQFLNLYCLLYMHITVSLLNGVSWVENIKNTNKHTCVYAWRWPRLGIRFWSARTPKRHSIRMPVFAFFFFLYRRFNNNINMWTTRSRWIFIHREIRVKVTF